MQNVKRFVKIIILLSSFLPACQSDIDFELYEKEILVLHQEMIDAHLNKDVGWFTKDISDNYFSVGRGEIRFPLPEETSAKFRNYLNNTEFTEYHDLQDPIVKFSKDASLAYLIVQVKVAGEQKIETDSTESFDMTWAWITLYERQANKWIRLGEVSNYK